MSQSSDVDGWFGIRVSYSPMTIDINNLEKDMTGLSLGFVKAFPISSQSPIFAETGADFQYFNSNILDEDGVKIDFNMYSIHVPINIGYKYAINETFSIFPYAGINARGNISGKITGSYGGEKESINVFDKDDMDDEAFKRLQIGWQIGCGVNFNFLYLSASYGGDFNKIAKDVELASAPSITLGVNF
jgi:hypothetical protein